METSISQQNWIAGELSANMRGRFDLPAYANGAERMVNFIPETTGPARYRSGTQYVNPTRRNQVACLIPFQFNDAQAYILEFTNGYIRFYQSDQILTLSSKVITGVTKANPGVVTSAAHGYSNGDEIIITGVVGMTQLNGRNFVVQNVTANTFQLYDTFGTNAINTSGYTTYSSGGVCNKIYEVTTPYSTADLFALKYAQNADTMYIVHHLYAPYKLIRLASTNWTMSTFVRASDPFTGAGNYPGAIAFYQGRLIYGYTDAYPESIWGSKPLDASGNPQYDDLDLGTGIATDGFKFTLSPTTGKVDKIQSLVPTLNFLAICTFEGISKCDGGQAGDPISASTIDITPAVTQGVIQQVSPILLGINLIFFHRSALIMYSMEFDIFYSAYNAMDQNINNEHITESGVTQLVYRNGRPPMFLYTRNDGVLIGVTFKAGGRNNADINGAHREIFGGTSSKVLSVGNMPREIAFDQTWLVIERVINNQTVRYVEFVNDEIIIPERDDYFNSDGAAGIEDINDSIDEDADDTVWRNAVFEAQKEYIFTDSTLTYDGSVYATVTMTPGATTGTGITFTASGNIFSATMVGREIWKKSIDGIGDGRAVITAYISPTQVTCNIVTDFDTVTVMPIDAWYLTTNVVSGIWHLEGQAVGILTDGGEHAEQTVTNGSLSLQYQASVVHVGLEYLGLIKSMSLEGGAQPGSGPSQGKTKLINRIDIHFLNTLEAKYGSSLYTLQDTEFRFENDLTGRPSPPFTGIKNLFFEDKSESEKHVYIVQDKPLPCTVLCVIPFLEVSDD